VLISSNIPTDIPRKKVLPTILRSLRSVKMTEKKKKKKTSTMIRELKFLGPATNLQEEMRGWKFG